MILKEFPDENGTTSVVFYVLSEEWTEKWGD